MRTKRTYAPTLLVLRKTRPFTTPDVDSRVPGLDGELERLGRLGADARGRARSG